MHASFVTSGITLIRSKSIPKFSINEVEVSRAILGCDAFISWLYPASVGGTKNEDSYFKDSNGELDASKVLDVMKTCVTYGVTAVDLPPPLIEVFQRLQAATDEEIVGLGALQEWGCKNFTLDGVPLEWYSEEIKATIRAKLPRYSEQVMKSNIGFIKSFFELKHSAQPLTTSQIDDIRIEPTFFEQRLELYRPLDVKLVQFGGGITHWLVSLGRVDLLQRLTNLIHKKGFTPLLICHWTSMVLPVAEKELEVAGYIVPLNKLWGFLTLNDALRTIKNVEKPVIAMKTLAHGALVSDLARAPLVSDLENAFSFIFKDAGATAALVGVSSRNEAEQTFSMLSQILARIFS